MNPYRGQCSQSAFWHTKLFHVCDCVWFSRQFIKKKWRNWEACPRWREPGEWCSGDLNPIQASDGVHFLPCSHALQDWCFWNRSYRRQTEAQEEDSHLLTKSPNTAFNTGKFIQHSWLTHLLSTHYVARCGGHSIEQDRVPILGNINYGREDTLQTTKYNMDYSVRTVRSATKNCRECKWAWDDLTRLGMGRQDQGSAVPTTLPGMTST